MFDDVRGGPNLNYIKNMDIVTIRKCVLNRLPSKIGNHFAMLGISAVF